MQNKSDEQLIKDYLKGNEQALEVLIKRYLKPIYSFVYKNIGNPEAAEDITQEVFIKVWKKLALYRTSEASSGAGFKTWIFTIAKNSSIDFLRKKKMAIAALNENSATEKNNFLEIIEQKNFMARIHNALQELSPSYRAIILLKNESNLTFREIAVSLGEPLNTIKSRYRRAINFLRDNASRNF